MLASLAIVLAMSAPMSDGSLCSSGGASAWNLRPYSKTMPTAAVRRKTLLRGPRAITASAVTSLKSDDGDQSDHDKSLVADTYCSEDVEQRPTELLDFDCLRDATASSAAVKHLSGGVADAAACRELCLGFAHRGLPCRAF
eukprot:SAG31_NODE_26727_length_437_cov_1.213018_1_plen_140_part_01